MSELLYRLGQFSARRAWTVIIAWVLALGLSVGIALTAGGSFTSAMTIDGLPAQATIDKLQTTFPDASRGVGQIIVHTTDGSEFTEADHADVAQALDTINSLDGVSETIDPFATQAELDTQRADAATAPDKLADAQAKIDAGRKKVTDGLAQLDDAAAEIADGKIELVNAQAELDAGAKELTTNKASLTRSRTMLEDSIAQMVLGGMSDDDIHPLRAQLEQVLEGLQQIAAGEAELAAAQDQIDTGWWNITVGEKDIAQGRIDLADAQKELDEGQAEIDAAQAELAPGQTLLAATESFRVVSADNGTAIITVLFDEPITEVPTEQRTAVVEAITAIGSDRLGVEVSQDLLRSLDSLMGAGEIVGIVIAGIVLFVMLGTFTAAGLPVIAALIGVGISATITMALSAVVEFTSTTPILGVMLGLAVGIDYALFILNRHRRQLKQGMTVRDSIALANGTSGNSVMFAGLTVIIALAALNLTGIGFLGIMGTMGAMAIAFSVLIAVTFTPAVISKLGMRVLSRKERAALAARTEAHETLAPTRTSAVLATRHPWLTVLATITALVIVALPAASMRLGLPDGSSEPLDSAGYKSYTLTKEAFGEGVNGALIVVAETAEPVNVDDELRHQADIAAELMTVDNVDAAIPTGFSDDRTALVFRVLPSEGPNALSTAEVVADVRALNTVMQDKFDTSIEVTGIAAINIDVSQKLGDALPFYLVVVIGLSFLLMVLVFRSIAVPVIASLGFLLTVFATLGAVTAVFQWGWMGELFDIHDPGPILSFLPTILVGILFGLAMDYQLFLASGMREAYIHGKPAKESVSYGIHLSRSVVVAAAIIMVSVFGGFIFSHTTMIRPMGFGLAAGVLIDAFVVRLLLVPATLSLLGDKAWWIPRWLDNPLPDVDVEGAKLERTHAH
ncbi:MAG: MMPL family transporter [Microbacteriaceae bacterium]